MLAAVVQVPPLRVATAAQNRLLIDKGSRAERTHQHGWRGGRCSGDRLQHSGLARIIPAPTFHEREPESRRCADPPIRPLAVEAHEVGVRRHRRYEGGFGGDKQSAARRASVVGGQAGHDRELTLTVNSRLQTSQLLSIASVRRATRLIRGDRQSGQNRMWDPTRSGTIRVVFVSWVKPCSSLVDRSRRGIGSAL